MISALEPVLLSDLQEGRQSAARVAFTPERTDEAWAQPLRVALLSAVISDDWSWLTNTEVRVTTIWSPELEGTLGCADVEKHRLYSEYMLGVVAERLPWLEFLLKATGATLCVNPGMCSFILPGDAEIHDIPPLLHYTGFLPWYQDAETAH